jgi:hypothetical protein
LADWGVFGSSMEKPPEPVRRVAWVLAARVGAFVARMRMGLGASVAGAQAAEFAAGPAACAGHSDRSKSKSVNISAT